MYKEESLYTLGLGKTLFLTFSLLSVSHFVLSSGQDSFRNLYCETRSSTIILSHSKMSTTPHSHGESHHTYTDKQGEFTPCCGHHHHDGHQYGGNTPTMPRPHQSMVSHVYNPPFYKVANPGPLGLFSFALTTFCLGLYNCGVG